MLHCALLTIWRQFSSESHSSLLQVEAHGPAQRSSRHSVAASAPGSARGSAAHVVADAAAFGGNSEDEEKGNGSGSGEAERDAQAPEAGIEEAQVEEDSHRASSRRDDTKVQLESPWRLLL